MVDRTWDKEIWESMAQGFMQGMEIVIVDESTAIRQLSEIYRVARNMAGKTFRPWRKMQHYAKYSKKLRTRQKYHKRLESFHSKIHSNLS